MRLRGGRPKNGAGRCVVEKKMAAKFGPVSEITSTDQISTITSTEFAHNEVGDRDAMSQKSSLAQVTRFVSGALPSDIRCRVIDPSGT